MSFQRQLGFPGELAETVGTAFDVLIFHVRAHGLLQGDQIMFLIIAAVSVSCMVTGAYRVSCCWRAHPPPVDHRADFDRAPFRSGPQRSVKSGR